MKGYEDTASQPDAHGAGVYESVYNFVNISTMVRVAFVIILIIISIVTGIVVVIKMIIIGNTINTVDRRKRNDNGDYRRGIFFIIDEVLVGVATLASFCCSRSHRIVSSHASVVVES